MGVNAGQLIITVIVIVVGIALFPVVQSTVDNSNATGSTGTLLDLVPLIYVAAILGIPAALLVVMFRRGGN